MALATSAGRQQALLHFRRRPRLRRAAAARACSSSPQQHELAAASLEHTTLCSSDGVWTTPLRVSLRFNDGAVAPPLALPVLPDAAAAARACPLLAAGLLLAACALLASPQLALQLPAGAALAGVWAQLLGLGFAFQALVTLLFQGCVQRGELGCTTCQRMLLASLLPFTSSLLVLHKAAAGGCTSVWLAIAAALQIGSFAVGVLCILPHQPSFPVQVFWPLLIALGLSEGLAGVASQLSLDLGSAGALQPLLAALVSVKAVRVMSRLLRSAAPRLSSAWLLPALRWAMKRVLPRLTASLAKVLPRVGRFAAPLIARLSRLLLRLAGRMAPRYLQDQVAGTTQQLAFPRADGLLTDAVARSIDLLPPKRTASWLYLALMMLAQMGMLLAAYSPAIMFCELPADAAADAALLRVVKFLWGCGFLVAAFACNSLKTAADRGHLARPANRQLNLALGLLQAGTALVLLQGMHTGAVAASSWAAWAQLAAAAAGAAFCGSVALPGAAGGAAAALVEVEPTPAPPLSSAEWQAVERGDPSAGAALSGTALVLTMLQLAL